MYDTGDKLYDNNRKCYTGSVLPVLSTGWNFYFIDYHLLEVTIQIVK